MELKEEYKTKLIIDWDNSCNEIINCIKESVSSIRIRMFMWRNDSSWRKILSALEEKIKSNPTIKIYIEKDSFWSLVYNIQKWISLWKLWWDIFSSDIWKSFLQNNKNINFSFVGSKSIFLFKYLKENDHSKVFLFDEFTSKSTALIWWMNISDEYLTAQNHDSPESWWWHDYMVKIEWNIADNFASYWWKYSKKWLAKKILEWIEVLMSIKNKHTIRTEIIKELKKAKKSIIIEHWYITDYLVIKKLRKISRKWIDIKIILPSYSDWFWNSNMHSIYRLLKPSALTHKIDSNIQVYLYNWMIHAKVIVIDKKIAIIWSANLTHWSFDILKETNAIFRQKDWIVKELITQINKDLKNCKMINLENIPKYNKWVALIQRIFI